ncbi:Ff.00g054970.m01.CDS01 [Fusarium sp. VM40]|nr:Ff.00g054970.m01.CDS01 [Fusarium sp. VM40]
MVSFNLALAIPTLVAVASAAKTTGPFSLYAYGPGIGGLPLFSTGDEVFIGNFTHSNNSEAAPIRFSVGTDKWLGSPNKTDETSGHNATWSNYTFAVPGPSSSSHTVKLTNSTSDGYVSNFLLYGSFVMLQSDTGFTSLWYASKTDDKDIYTIGWNATASDDKVPVTLKSTPPSN